MDEPSIHVTGFISIHVPVQLTTSSRIGNQVCLVDLYSVTICDDHIRHIIYKGYVWDAWSSHIGRVWVNRVRLPRLLVIS